MFVSSEHGSTLSQGETGVIKVRKHQGGTSRAMALEAKPHGITLKTARMRVLQED